MRACEKNGNVAILAGHEPRQPGRGFTIIELLVVVAIIVTLIAILIPSLWKMYDVANKGKATALLGAIRTGLEQYYNDFHMYPPSSGGSRGSVMLAQGLMGPGGNPAFGFHMQTVGVGMGGGATGQIYGPYVPPDPNSFKAAARLFVDPWGNEVLYYRSTQAGGPAASPPTSIFAAGGTNAYFNANDCASTAAAPTTTSPFFTLISGSNTNAFSGAVTGATGYLLISAGPDQKFFTGDDIVAGK